jgi:hypothetical protein
VIILKDEVEDAERDYKVKIEELKTKIAVKRLQENLAKVKKDE